MRCLLLTALAALPGCNLITDFDRDLVVVLEVLGDIPEPRLELDQRARVGRCEAFCELTRDCIRDPDLNPTCDYVAPGRDHTLSNETYLFNSCVGLCVAVEGPGALGIEAIRTCEPILAEPEPGAEDSLRQIASRLFCSGNFSLCANFFCAPLESGSTVFEACSSFDLGKNCVLNCERYLPADYWSCVGRDASSKLGATTEDEFAALCSALGYCVGPLPE